LSTLGVVYHRLGQYPQAIETLERSLGRSQRDLAAINLLFLAMCHARRGDTIKAQDCYQSAVQWLQEEQDKLHPSWKEQLNGIRSEAEELLRAKN
jgi:tetratricopeptide (TPR) repeat protein